MLIRRKMLIFSFFICASIWMNTVLCKTEVFAQTGNNQTLYEVEILEVINMQEDLTDAGTLLSQTLRVQFLTGPLKTQLQTIEIRQLASISQVPYEAGDHIMINSTGTDGQYQVSDYVRRSPLLTLFILFLLLSILIGRMHGIRSLLGLVVSFGGIFFLILPAIKAGFHPVFVAVISAIIISIVTYYLSHGYNKGTTIALFGTFFALIITGILGELFINFTHLTGFTSDEAFFLQLNTGTEINIRGLILAGIIIGTLGALDDVTIAQVNFVREIKHANPRLDHSTIFRRAMLVGRDHIASLVNTLILVYTGGALPLMLLFLDSSLSFSQAINYEVIAEEIVRTLVASIGLILAVPITTLIAVKYASAIKPES